MRGWEFRSVFDGKGKGGALAGTGPVTFLDHKKGDTKSSDLFASTPCTVRDPNGTSVTYADEVFRVVYGSF